MTFPKLSLLNRHAIIRLARQGYTTAAIGSAFGVSRQAVSQTLRNRGMSLEGDKGKRTKKRHVSLFAKAAAHVSALRTV